MSKASGGGGGEDTRDYVCNLHVPHRLALR